MATETAYGASYGTWVGVVVNRDDPLKAGRVQVRVYGVHDDTVNVPDSDLPWAYPNSGIASASLNHVGVSPTGMMVGTQVHGYWNDRDQTVPTILGTKHRSQIETPGSGQTSQQGDPSLLNDVSHNARGSQSAGVPGETNMGKDYSTPIQQSIPDKFNNSNGDQSVQYQSPQSGTVPTIGAMTFQSGQKVLSIMQQVDPQNAAGSIQGALQGMIGLNNLINAGGSMGGGSFGSMFNGIISQIVQATSSVSTTNPSSTSSTSTSDPNSPSSSGSGSSDLQTALQAVKSLIASPDRFDMGPGTARNSTIRTLIRPILEKYQNQLTPDQLAVLSSNDLAQLRNLIQQLIGTGVIQPQDANSAMQTVQSASDVGSAMSSIISALQSSFLNNGGQQGGIGSFDQQQGVIKALTDQANKIFGS